jgi:hypothetical protein
MPGSPCILPVNFLHPSGPYPLLSCNHPRSLTAPTTRRHDAAGHTPSTVHPRRTGVEGDLEAKTLGRSNGPAAEPNIHPLSRQSLLEAGSRGQTPEANLTDVMSCGVCPLGRCELCLQGMRQYRWQPCRCSARVNAKHLEKTAPCRGRRASPFRYGSSVWSQSSNTVTAINGMLTCAEFCII